MSVAELSENASNTQTFVYQKKAKYTYKILPRSPKKRQKHPNAAKANPYAARVSKKYGVIGDSDMLRQTDFELCRFSLRWGTAVAIATHTQARYGSTHTRLKTAHKTPKLSNVSEVIYSGRRG